MGCPHSDSDTPCAKCVATREAEPQAETVEDFDGHTLQRDRPPSGYAPAAATAKIGRYVVLDVLGKGGMGVVYTAYDPVLNRRVAIKVLRTPPGKGSESTGGATRLIREAQAMAQLAHPNVVPVYDVGSEGTSVFVAMELVVGTTLAAWVKAKRPSWRELLQVFIAAGRGLQAAHEAGLVHRDFKPANVLMGEDGRPRVTDFGLARSTKSGSSDDHHDDSAEITSPITLETPLTRAGAVMGSPGYMAPEQYEGAATSPATDEYAFCVSLYESLYGERPFAGRDLATLGKLTREGKIPPPPKGSPVPPWIHQVLVKGLAPDPAARHPSMAALLDALSRDPARTRNRWLAGGVTLALAASATFGWQWLSQRQARECRATAVKLATVWDESSRARAEGAFTATGRSFAGVSWARARDAMDAYAKAWVAERIDACEATRVRREQSERQLSLRLECLDRRLDELSTLATAFTAADATLVGQASAAVARLSPVASCANLKALEARARLAPEARERVEAMQRQIAQGRLLVATGQLAAAREKLEPAVKEAAALAVPTFIAETFEAQGELERESAHYTDARTAFEKSTEAALAAGDDAVAARVLASLVSLVGWRLERPAEALLLASITRGVLGRIGGDRAIEAQLDEGIGDAQWQAGDRLAALASYRKALAATEALQGAESADVARLHSSVGWILMERGQLAEARGELEASRLVREKLLGAEHPSLGYTWNELGTLAMQAGDAREAVRCFERSLAIHTQNLGAEAFPVTRAHLNIAEALADDGRFDEAAAVLPRAQENLARMSDPPASGLMQLARTRAECASGAGHHVEAMQLAKEATTIAEQNWGAVHPDTAVCVFVLALTLDAAGRRADALQAWDRYFTMADKLNLKGSRDYPRALIASGRVLVGLGRAKEGAARLERALEVLTKFEGNGRARCDAQLALAEALWASAGDKQRARELAEEARAGYALLSREDDVERARSWQEAHR